jgi:hypothetical protein
MRRGRRGGRRQGQRLAESSVEMDRSVGRRWTSDRQSYGGVGRPGHGVGDGDDTDICAGARAPAASRAASARPSRPAGISFAAERERGESERREREVLLV